MNSEDLCKYIRNTGQVPLRIDDFDDDWTPAGEEYRRQLVVDGLIELREGGIVLTEAGERKAEESKL